MLSKMLLSVAWLLFAKRKFLQININYDDDDLTEKKQQKMKKMMFSLLLVVHIANIIQELLKGRDEEEERMAIRKVFLFVFPCKTRC